jgi:hypothetical protein
MDLKSIVSEICDQADDFLAGVTKRDEAKAGVAELLTIRYSKLPPADRKTVTEQVMRILEREAFFERDPGKGDEDIAAAEE